MKGDGEYRKKMRECRWTLDLEVQSADLMRMWRCDFLRHNNHSAIDEMYYRGHSRQQCDGR